VGCDLWHLEERGVEVGNGADDVQVGLRLEQCTKPRSHQAIVVDDQYSNPLRQESLRVSRDCPEGP